MKTVLTGETQTGKLNFEMVVTFWNYSLESRILPYWSNLIFTVLQHMLVYGKAKVPFHQTLKMENFIGNFYGVSLLKQVWRSKYGILSRLQTQYQTSTELGLHNLLRITEDVKKKKKSKFTLFFCYLENIWDKHSAILLS